MLRAAAQFLCFIAITAFSVMAMANSVDYKQRLHTLEEALKSNSALADNIFQELQIEKGNMSAEACLWADVGIDPGGSGHQSFEASQFMFYKHTPDPTTHLLLWQIGIAGEHTLTEFHTSSDRLQVLVEQLNEWYPLQHEVILYEAPNLPTQAPRIERISLAQLPFSQLSSITTLLIPPAKQLEFNHQILAKLGITADDLG